MSPMLLDSEYEMHRLNIIGVSGQAGSGKDTVANYLCEEYGFTKIALADPIKRFGYHVFHFSVDQLWGPSHCRNAVDERYHSDQVWEEAQARMEAWGHEYVVSVLGDDDPLKVDPAVAALTHWFFWLRNEYQGKLSPRIMLQALGTEWRRDAIGSDVWMNCLLRDARTLLHEDGATRYFRYDALEGLVDVPYKFYKAHPMPSGVVVSDIRFENEFQRIRNEGGAVIRILRPDTDAEAATIGIAGHASEAHAFSFDNFDFILKNEGTLVDLYRAVDMYMPVFLVNHH
jgi:hypothetical protein